jgi:plastocyanin
MMKSIHHILLLLVVFFCAGIIFLSQTAGTQEQKVFPDKKIAGTTIVRIGYLSGIVPNEVTIKSGTTVIWLNESIAAMQVQFTSKKVTMACQAPIHFSVDEAGGFTSDRIPMGAVASLCFIEKGLYEYLVRRISSSAGPALQEAEFKGTIIVE